MCETAKKILSLVDAMQNCFCTDCFSFFSLPKVLSLVSFRCTDYSCFHAVVQWRCTVKKHTEHKLSIRWINIHLQQLSFNEAFITHWSIFMRMKLGPTVTVCEIFSINNSLFIFSRRGDGDKKEAASRELLSWQLRGRAVINFMVGNFNFSCFSLFCAFFPWVFLLSEFYMSADDPAQKDELYCGANSSRRPKFHCVNPWRDMRKSKRAKWKHSATFRLENGEFSLGKSRLRWAPIFFFIFSLALFLDVHKNSHRLSRTYRTVDIA